MLLRHSHGTLFRHSWGTYQANVV